MNYGNFMREFKVTSKLPAYVLPEGFELRLTIFAGKPVDVEDYPPYRTGTFGRETILLQLAIVIRCRR